ncbi:hypothetical protein VTP01DRAFT_3838 [Rhizomucor pusillus]|uniref:uncharacterized protein n=1 Tax=Rhizomucor pusillus TaxID=4840 RepID=UPI003744A154
MKFSLTATALLSFAASAFAQSSAASGATPNAGVAVTAPGLGAVWTAGKAQTVAWTVQDNSVQTIDSIELRNGLSANLHKIGVIGTNIPVAPGSWTWNIPSTVQSDGSYVLVLNSNKGSTYSPYFTIMGAAPNSNSSMLPEPTATGASGSAGGSGSGSGSGASASQTNSENSASALMNSGVVAVAAGAVAGAAAILF